MKDETNQRRTNRGYMRYTQHHGQRERMWGCVGAPKCDLYISQCFPNWSRMTSNHCNLLIKDLYHFGWCWQALKVKLDETTFSNDLRKSALTLFEEIVFSLIAILLSKCNCSHFTALWGIKDVQEEIDKVISDKPQPLSPCDSSVYEPAISNDWDQRVKKTAEAWESDLWSFHILFFFSLFHFLSSFMRMGSLRCSHIIISGPYRLQI